MYGKELKYPNKNPDFPAAIGPVVVVRDWAGWSWGGRPWQMEAFSAFIF